MRIRARRIALDLFFKLKDTLIDLNLIKDFDHFILYENNQQYDDYFMKEQHSFNIEDKQRFNSNSTDDYSLSFKSQLYSKYDSGKFKFNVIYCEKVIVQSRFGLVTKSGYILAEPFYYNLVQENRYTRQLKNDSILRDRDFLQYLFRPKTKNIDKATVISTSAANNNYSHFLIDFVPKLLFVKSKLDLDEYIIVNGPIAQYVFDLFELLKLKNKLVVMDNSLALKITTCRIIGPLSPRGNPTNEVISNLYFEIIPYSNTRIKIKANIYISRRLAKARKILNENELEISLSKLGYEIVFLENQSISNQIALFKSAKNIISPHGAGLTNLVFCEKQTNLLEIFSSEHFEPSMFNIAAVKKLNYTFIVFESLNNNNDYIVDIDKIINIANGFLNQEII